MSKLKTYLAVDLGAGSGRVLAGEFDGSRIRLRELNRFENKPVQLPSGWHWKTTDFYQHILEGFKEAAKEYGDSPISVGIDTWGVDYALLDGGGKLLGIPYQYRDSRTDGIMESTYEKVSQKDIYATSGIQFMFFNTIFQLMAEVKSPAISVAEDILFMPDLLGFWLTGKKVQERTIVSTSQLYNPIKRDWDYELIEKLGLPKKIFKSIVDPGQILGELSPFIKEETGLSNLSVITVAGHDTASAVAAVPSEAEYPAYLSSGTWSLMGLELKEPIISDDSFNDAFTNEIGFNGSVRFLKNLCGLWLIQESRRYWQSKGEDYGYGKMASLASEASSFKSFIDPDDSIFAQHGKMPEKIQEYCKSTNQPVPQTEGEIIRCIYESLALKYAIVWERLMHYAPEKPKVLHVVGGGCQDKLLNQFTANALNLTVEAGPVEATGLGNILAQMLANGDISSLREGRRIVAKSFPSESFEPINSDLWQEQLNRFKAITDTGV